jgi:DNA-binding NarL/FixJ family response regulator
VPPSAGAVELMTRVLALIPDLLFGSRVQSMLTLAGHDVTLVADPGRLGTHDLSGTVLIVDLTGELDGVEVVRELSERDVRTLGFYSHVDVATRQRAEQAGFDLVVPRSRMARECSELLERVISV